MGLLENQSAQCVADAFRGDMRDTLPFLVLGGAPSLVPYLDPASCRDTPCAGIVLVGAVTPAELAEVLDAQPDPAIPIADFGANRQLRSDYVGETFDSEAAAGLRTRFAPILHRLGELPFHGAREDRAGLTILRLAYSRNSAIEAAFDPASRNLVEYPLLGRTASIRPTLEGLAALALLRRRHFTRTHLCTRCESARLHAVEACPACNGTDLEEQSIVHHYRCGWQEPERNFVEDRALVCPKCRRELRHYGVDYDKPGTALVCRACRNMNSEPAVQFVCLDCGKAGPTREARSLDWYHYDLADDGLRAIRDGRIPRFDIGDYLDGHPRAFAPRDFRLLVGEGLRVARRYGRPFSIGKISFGDASALRRDHGSPIVDNTFRAAVDIVVETLRNSDFIGVDDAHSIVIGFPETSQKQALGVLNVLSGKVRKVVTVPVEMKIASAEGERAHELLALDQRP